VPAPNSNQGPGHGRRLIVWLSLAVFVAYCVAAFRGQCRYRLPPYRCVTLRILGGATPSQWARPEYASQRHDRLSTLAQRHYQPGMLLDVGDRILRPGHTLTKADFEALVRHGVHEVKLRDPRDILRLAARELRLRQDVVARGPGPRRVVAHAGELLTKDVVDRCLMRGISEVAVVGTGDVVGFNATLLMVVLIFIAMTLVLIEIFWNPVTALIETRQHEIEAGKRLTAANTTQGQRLDHERRNALRQIREAYRERVARERAVALKEVSTITRHAKGRLKQKHEEAAATMHLAVRTAESALQRDVPALSVEIVGRVTRLEKD